jgi:hypothetical protein
MKKIIIGLSGILIAACIILKVANAQGSTQEVKKTATEMSKDNGKGPSGSACKKMTCCKTADGKTCDPAKCKEMKCDSAKCKEGKSGAACKTKCANAKGEKKK